MADKIDPIAPMSAADHALAHALTALVTMRIYDHGRVEMLRAVLTDVGRASQSANPHILALKDAAREVLRADPATAHHCRSHLTARDAIQRFSEWRLGMALERVDLKNQRRPAVVSQSETTRGEAAP